MPCLPPLCPEDDFIPLLEALGVEAGYIALHPFRDVRRMAPLTSELMPSGAQGEAEGPAETVSRLLAFARRQASAGPQEQERLWREIERVERRSAAALRWDQVCIGAGLQGAAQLYRALLTGVGSIHPRHEDMAGAAQLSAWCQRYGALEPGQGAFQPLMQKPIGTAFLQAGVDRVCIADAFGDVIGDIAASTLAADEPWEFAVGGTCGSLYSPDGSMTFTVRWDGFFTLLCGTQARLASVRTAELFDGFWCTPETPHGWWMGDGERAFLKSISA